MSCITLMRQAMTFHPPYTAQIILTVLFSIFDERI